MNYHLNHDGQNLGIFPLEELRRRRMARELTGVELVWCPGMANWQPLDVVLREASPNSGQPTAPPVAPKTNYVVPVVVITVAVVLTGMCIVAGFFVKQVVVQANKVVQESMGGSDAMTSATKPVVVNSNGITAREVTETNREFRVRQYVDGYKLRGERNAATDALALGLVENWIACNYNGTVDTNLPPLTELADKLANDPACTDPLILTVAADNSVELHEAVKRLERAQKGFENSKHLGYPKFYATVLLGDKIFADRTARLPALDALAMGHLREALHDGSILPGDQPELAELLVSGWAKEFFDRNDDDVVASVKAQGSAFEWLAQVLEGERQINAAWRSRGNGYSDSVSEAGWQGFRDHLALAREALTKAWKLRQDLPLAPCLMMTVALGNSDLGEIREWFDRTTSAQMDYAGAWKEMRWALRPRWYGNEKAMLAFGVMALNTGRFDTQVPREFYNSVLDLEAEMSLADGEHIFGRKDIWPHLQAMYEGYIAATSGGTQRGWRSAYAVVAYLAGKPEVASQQLAALNWQPNHENLTGWNRDLSLMAEEMAARTGAQSAEVKRAEDDREGDDFAGALKIYQALAATQLEPPVQRFVNERLISLDLERRLNAGNWVDFLPATTNLAGWQVERGQCKVLPDGALEVQSDENGHLLYSRVRMGADFEVRGQFELVHSTDQQFQGGLVMGVPQFETQNWYAFRMKRTTAEGDIASFSQHWTRRQVAAPAVIVPGTNTFWFSFRGCKVTATVNGHEVFHDINPPEDSEVSTNEFLLGLGAFNDSNTTVIRYRNLQVHLLTGQN